MTAAEVARDAVRRVMVTAIADRDLEWPSNKERVFACRIAVEAATIAYERGLAEAKELLRTRASDLCAGGASDTERRGA